jgi:hypothetical protein
MSVLTIENVADHWRCGRASGSDPQSAAKHKNIKVTRFSSGGLVGFFYYSPLVIDLDGAPNAYGPKGSQHLDNIKNAGDPKKGYYGVLAYSPDELNHQNKIWNFTDESPAKEKLRIDLLAPCLLGKYPVFQRSNQPGNGFYVSTNPMIVEGRNGLPAWDQNKYSNAAVVPYGALGGKLKKEGLSLGDKCLSIRLAQMRSVEYPFGDSAGAKSSNLAEVSLATALELGAKNQNDNEFLSCHFVFQRSKSRSARSIFNEISQASNASDLLYLVACQVEAGPSVNVIPKLRVLQNQSIEERLRRPVASNPSQYSSVRSALSHAGFVPMGSFDTEIRDMG